MREETKKEEDMTPGNRRPNETGEGKRSSQSTGTDNSRTSEPEVQKARDPESRDQATDSRVEGSGKKGVQ